MRTSSPVLSTLLAKLQNSPVATTLPIYQDSFQKLLPKASTGLVPEKTNRLRASIIVLEVESSAKPSLPFRRSSHLRSVRDIVSAMPSYLRHSGSTRSYSFPPCIESFDFGASEADLPDIDEEPFAHFISPVVEEDDPYDAMSLSAGIVVHESERSSKTNKFKSSVADKWARYVRQNHTQLHTRYHDQRYDEEDESFMQLEDDRLNDTPHVVTQLTTPAPRITVTEPEPTRGRAQELLSRRNRRRYSRTLSGHRHSWREPSPDLFTVDESEEDDMPALRRTKTKKTKDGVERRRSSKPRVRFELPEKSRL